MGLDGYRKVRYNGSMDEKKIKTSFSISARGKRLLKTLAERMGISQSSVIELLVRKETENWIATTKREKGAK